ncbi:HAMP domain-containing histidine kinase [Streptomyces pactum]|uniref:histidine kinase n=1 Tax=Streptomyces pactum TaxID=68249 RepID=A0ABS0NPN4_9ACTN|nr:HAMP domain-containing sensor histidine kinase [Streptomyces pactum]MBH5337052.1 HAMP domain-containing histidine kinase [Streptomyces pactum]
MRRPFGSVRSRAALGATVVVAVALVAAGLAVLGVLRANLSDQADLESGAAAREVAARIAAGTPPERLELDEEPPVQVVDDRGRVRAVSDELEAVTGTGSRSVRPVTPADAGPPGARPGGADRPGSGDRPPAGGTQRGDAGDPGDADDGADDGADDTDDGDDDGPGRDDGDDDGSGRDDGAAAGPWDTGDFPDEIEGYTDGTATIDGERAEYRFAAVAVTTPAGEEVTVHAGAPLTAEREAVGTVRRAMLAGLVPLLLVVAGVTWLVTRRALRPVEGIRREMSAITASTDLGRRVPEPGSRDEIARLARTTNETLAALEASVERQRRFVADASHELRSPIASLRTQLEVGAAHPELLDLDGAVADVVRLQRLAADLLLLARLDAGERPQPDARVDLAELVRRELARRPPDRVPVRAGEPAEVTVAGSRGQLARVLANLVDNAVRHAERQVRVSVLAEGGEAILRVEDDGPGVPAGERERIFERFVRLDDARSRDDGGAGLGLAIARDVVRRHAGTLTVGAAADGGARFDVRLPVVRPPAPGDPADRREGTGRG